jgi:putative endopeptidase
MNFRLQIGFVTLVFLSACNHPAVESKPDFLASNVDTTVSPATDFFLYANGNWVKRTPVPAEESGWGLGNMVDKEIYERLRKINTDADSANAAQGTITKKIGDFWHSGMDTVEIEKNGIKPLIAELGAIDAIQTKEDILGEAALLHTIGVDVLFSDYVWQDDMNSGKMVYHLMQGGLGMPNREYYLNTDLRTAGIRKAYGNYLVKTFEELGADSLVARQKAGAVLDLENKMAKASRKLEDLRDTYKNYHKLTVAGVEKLCPQIDWLNYLKEIGAQNVDSIIVGQPEFFSALGHALTETPVSAWKDYLDFHLIMASANFLDSATYHNSFTYHATLSGALVPKVRWKRVIDSEQKAMGEALGQLFVKEYFSDKAKQRYIDLIENMRTAFKERIARLTWMTDSTKVKAYHKLALMTKKVGYPDKWKDFSSLKIDKGPYVLNMQNASAWWQRYNIGKLGKPVDRIEWQDLTPQTWNAYYNPSNNEIVMSAAGFLIPGTKDEDLDEAFVYGYAGANWIGHEMTHGFDDQGRLYDENGNLRSWWQPADSIQFAKRAQKIIRQFNEFNPVDTLHINGSATQGENIADLGGLVIGLDAFRKTESYKNGEKIGGFTPLQRYFLGYAYGWMSVERKERLAREVMTDLHAPAKERVNGPVVNIPEFYEAFAVKPGDKMFRPDSLRVSIW